MKLKLKICGMCNPENIAEVAELQPDYMGFIFYEKSPRYVGEQFVMPAIKSTIQKVGIFVNQDNSYILSKVEKCKLDFVQLHGTETAEQCKLLADKGLKIIKAFSIDESFDFKAIRSYTEYVNYVLFDTKGKHFGGNAKVFDWQLLQQYDQQIPFFLSGGISSENVVGIARIKSMNLHALDVNSGVEVSPGIKNISKINELKRVLDSW